MLQDESSLRGKQTNYLVVTGFFLVLRPESNVSWDLLQGTLWDVVGNGRNTSHSKVNNKGRLAVADENLHCKPRIVQILKCNSVKALQQRTNSEDQDRLMSNGLLQKKI